MKNETNMNCNFINIIYFLIAMVVIFVDVLYLISCLRLYRLNFEFQTILILAMNLLFFTTFKARVLLKEYLIKRKFSRINNDSDVVKYCNNYFSMDANNHYVIGILKYEPCFINAEDCMNELTQKIPEIMKQSFKEIVETRKITGGTLFYCKRSDKNWAWKTWLR
mgnify:CR=1 FL=1